ncbi:MAG: DsrE family protein [Burkholderiaceae bacterium]|jgi:intracellular sulfur oxidation DsrE/DsrF family protein|nr:DsrE family protein [Burkholderiaceae bacterium]
MKHARTRRSLIGLLFLAPLAPLAAARTTSPWGSADEIERHYAPAKAVYDVDARNAATLARVLDRISYLNKVYEANPFESAIVVVVHGEAIPLFGIRDLDRYRAVMERAQSLTQSGPIEFRVCRADAAMRGYAASDIHGFARMVPMADAEIVRLQGEGYAYMR